MNTPDGPVNTSVRTALPVTGRAGMESWVEYGVQYDAPECYAGLVTNVRESAELCASIARAEQAHPGGEFKCHVVQRTVTCAPWEAVSE